MNVKKCVKGILAAVLTLVLCVPVVLNVLNVNAATGPYIDVQIQFLNADGAVVTSAKPNETITVKVTAVAKNADGSEATPDYGMAVDVQAGVSGFDGGDKPFENNNGVYTLTVTTPAEPLWNPQCDVLNASAWINGESVSIGDQQTARLDMTPYLVQTGDCGDGSSSGGSSSGGDSTVSGNVPSDNSPAPSSSSSSSSAPAEAPANKVVAGGSVVESAVGGVYTAKSVNGVAVTSPVANVAAAAGLNETDVANGTNVRFYVCDSRNKEAKTALKDVADASGRRIIAYIDADLYTITKDGVVSNIRMATSPVTMVFGLPGSLIDQGHTYSVICLAPDGTAVVFDDVDTNNATVTINANVFGTYAIAINP